MLRSSVTLSTCVKFSADDIWNTCSHFSQDTGFDSSYNCPRWRQSAWNVESCFLGKNREHTVSLPSAEFAKRVVKFKWWQISSALIYWIMQQAISSQNAHCTNGPNEENQTKSGNQYGILFHPNMVPYLPIRVSYLPKVLEQIGLSK